MHCSRWVRHVEWCMFSPLVASRAAFVKPEHSYDEAVYYV